MFKSEFQGGPLVEVFSCQGKEPLAKWKLSGSSIQKIYEKEVKSYVFSLDGSSATTKMQLPKDSKQTLALVQRYFVVQLFSPVGAAVSLELGIIDTSNNKRRLLFSTAQKEISITPLHVKLPLLVLRRGVWLNLCLDLVSIVGEAFRGQTFKSLDSITLSASCKVRKIFTMKAQPQDSTDDDEMYEISPATNSVEIDVIPRSCQFAFDVMHQTQVITMTKLRQAEFKLRADASRPSSSTEPDLNSSMRSKDDRPMHIAFGTKVPVPQNSQSRKSSAGQPREGSITSRSSKSSGTHRPDESSSNSSGQTTRRDGHNRQKSDPGSEVKDPNLSADAGTLTGSKTWSAGVINPDEKLTLQPHPPRQKSAEKSRRVVKVRPSSAKKESDSSAKKEEQVKEPNTSRILNGSSHGAYDPKRYYSDSKGAEQDSDNKWSDLDQDDGHMGRDYSKTGDLRTSKEVKVVSRINNETKSRKGSESSEGLSVSESDVASDALGSSFKKPPSQGKGESQSESDDWAARSRDHKSSRIPRRKKRSEKKVSLMDSLSENEEVQYDLRRIRDERRGITQTDSGVGLTESRTSTENLSSLEEDSGIQNKSTSPKILNSSRREKQDGNGGNLYTFMSPPRSAPTRQMERSNHLDQKTLQLKLQKIQESTSSLPGSHNSEEEKILQNSQNGGDFTKTSLDASLPEDAYAAIMKRTPSPRMGHSPIPRELEIEENKDQRETRWNGQGSQPPDLSPTASPSPVQSHSPTLRRWKLDASRKGKSSHQDRDDKGRSFKDGMPQPLTSQISPRTMGTMSRLSIHASKVKEISKDDPRLSDDYDWRKYQSNNSSLASSLEAKMLASLKREQLEEMYEEEAGPPVNNSFDLHNYGDDDLSSSSDDTTTTFSTWKPPDITKGGHKFQDEMHFPASSNTLMQSNPRDWGNVFSPPIVLPSEKIKEESLVEHLSPSKETPPGGGIGFQRQQSSTGSDGSTGVVTGPDANGEEELDLLYDPCLNCYFDPVTGKYYELA